MLSSPGTTASSVKGPGLLKKLSRYFLLDIRTNGRILDIVSYHLLESLVPLGRVVAGGDAMVCDMGD